MDKNEIIRQIDEVLSWREGVDENVTYSSRGGRQQGEMQLITTFSNTIRRFAPAGSTFCEQAYEALQYQTSNPIHTLDALQGILYALHHAYEKDHLKVFEQLVHADVFSDFFEMAEYLLSENYKDAAAVIAGAVLEENLRKLCVKHGISVLDTKGKPKRADAMNNELGGASVYNKLEQKSVTAWLDLRNKAAHGRYIEYDQQQVENYMQGILAFLTRHSA